MVNNTLDFRNRLSGRFRPQNRPSGGQKAPLWAIVVNCV